MSDTAPAKPEKIIQAIESKGGGFAAYRAMVTGSAGMLYWLKYELCMLLFRNVPGVLGYALRRCFFSGLFGRCGRKPIIGTGITLRNPRAITLGDNVILDDNCVLDAKGESGRGIHIGSSTFVSRNALLSCKHGGIFVGAKVSLGPNTVIHSIGEKDVRIGDSCAIAANCYLIGAGDYIQDRTDIPMTEQGFKDTKGIVLENDVWLAAAVVVTDGSRIGRSSIVGCCSMVRGEIPPLSIAHGVPARVVRQRP
jgi:acetyltransferase-like isoleucine patch superfamily enzyme